MSRSALVLVSFPIIAVLLAACSSGSVKARRDQRDKLVQTSKLYCEFVNGENHPTDLDVALNLSMAQKCDFEKPHSLSSYRTPSEVQGMVYCCAIAKKDKDKKDDKPMARSDVRPELPQVNAPAKAGSTGAPPTVGAPSSSGKPAAKPAPGTPSKSDSPYPKIPDLDP